MFRTANTLMLLLALPSSAAGADVASGAAALKAKTRVWEKSGISRDFVGEKRP